MQVELAFTSGDDITNKKNTHFRGAIDIMRGIGYTICTKKIKLVWEADDSLSWQ